jgi:hypothetical protein
MIRTLGPSCGFSCRLDRWQQQRDQYANNGDDHQQLNKSHPITAFSH